MKKSMLKNLELQKTEDIEIIQVKHRQSNSDGSFISSGSKGTSPDRRASKVEKLGFGSSVSRNMEGLKQAEPQIKIIQADTSELDKKIESLQDENKALVDEKKTIDEIS